jgi:hypothetical protein
MRRLVCCPFMLERSSACHHEVRMHPARASLFLLALLVSGLSLAAAPVFADEVPTDPNTIERLTPEQARTLVEEFPGVEVQLARKVWGTSTARCLALNGLKSLDEATARALVVDASRDVGSAYPLLLDGLTTLDANAAKALAESIRPYLSLDGLTRLDTNAARALAGCKTQRYLSLKGLTTLDPDTARALAACNGCDLDLSGLTTLDANTAQGLTRLEGEGPFSGGLQGLFLDGLTRLDPDVTKLVAAFRVNYVLSLDGLTELDAGTATSLAGCRVRYLSLNGLTTLDAAAAKALAAYTGKHLWLKGLTRLDADAARALVEYAGDLRLDGLTTLDPAAGAALAEYMGRELHLDGLTTLDADTAALLATFKGYRLSCTGLTTLDADAAKTIAGLNAWNGELPHVTTLESPDAVAVAQALAARKGPLRLKQLNSISPKTLTALMQKEDVELPRIQTLQIIPEPDGSPTDDFVIPEEFQLRQNRARTQ